MKINEKTFERAATETARVIIGACIAVILLMLVGAAWVIGNYPWYVLISFTVLFLCWFIGYCFDRGSST